MRFPNDDAYMVITNNAAFRREAFESLGGFDETFAFATEDRELSHRLAASGRLPSRLPGRRRRSGMTIR